MSCDRSCLAKVALRSKCFEHLEQKYPSRCFSDLCRSKSDGKIKPTLLFSQKLIFQPWQSRLLVVVTPMKIYLSHVLDALACFQSKGVFLNGFSSWNRCSKVQPICRFGYVLFLVLLSFLSRQWKECSRVAS